MGDQFIARLQRLLKAHLARHRTWSTLADAINEANDNDPERRIDRRRLEKLAGGDCVTTRLSVGQLITINNYFITVNEPPLLASDDSLIDAIAESPTVSFFVAATFHKKLNTEVVSGWDLRAITSLQRTRLSQLRPRIWEVTDPESWARSDSLLNHGANIAIGSPIANYASEVLLSEMLGIVPGKKPPVERLPFCIVGAKRDRGLKSAFVRSRLDAEKRNSAAAERIDPMHRALIVDDQVFAATEDEDYALLVAQRNKERRVHAVLAGLSGLGTYQLAEELQSGSLPQSLPPLRSGQRHPPILVAAFKLTMERNARKGKRAGETRRVRTSSPIYGPALVHAVDDQWQFFQASGNQPVDR
jgi:hypothetical protein